MSDPIDAGRRGAGRSSRRARAKRCSTALSNELGVALVGSHIALGDDLWMRVSRDAWVDDVPRSPATSTGCAGSTSCRRSIGCRRRSAGRWTPRSTPSCTARPPRPPTPMATGVAGGDTRFQLLRPGLQRDRATGASPSSADLPDDDLVVADAHPGLPRRQLARARGVGDVRHRVRRSSRPPQALPARPRSRASRCARTSRCWPAWSSRGRASSTSSRCRATTDPKADAEAGRRR